MMKKKKINKKKRIAKIQIALGIIVLLFFICFSVYGVKYYFDYFKLGAVTTVGEWGRVDRQIEDNEEESKMISGHVVSHLTTSGLAYRFTFPIFIPECILGIILGSILILQGEYNLHNS